MPRGPIKWWHVARCQKKNLTKMYNDIFNLIFFVLFSSFLLLFLYNLTLAYSRNSQVRPLNFFRSQIRSLTSNRDNMWPFMLTTVNFFWHCHVDQLNVATWQDVIKKYWSKYENSFFPYFFLISSSIFLLIFLAYFFTVFLKD